jgi:hypothetical protein
MPDLPKEIAEALTQGDHEEAILDARNYYDGDHHTMITERQRKYLELAAGQEFNANYCTTVVDVLTERLFVTGVKPDKQATVLWDWWKLNRMDLVQGVVHLAAVRDGDAYVLVEWDNDLLAPDISFEPAYDGIEGTKCVYSNDDRTKVLFAFKRWRSDSGSERLNIYHPDEVEKWELKVEEGGGSNWTVIETVRWTQADGEPLGVPIVHFKNRDQGFNYGVSELRDVIPLQNALNKAVIDLVAAADTTAFRIFWMLGDDPSDLKVQPGSWIFSERPPGEVDVGYFQGESLEQLINYVTEFALQIARVSRTPVSFFQISKQRPAEGTLKQEEAGLVARARNRQGSFGNSWEQVFDLARLMWNAFGAATEGNKLDLEAVLETVWRDPESRNDLVEMQTLAVKRKTLEVPLEFLWAEAGYTPEQIQKMQESEEWQAKIRQREALIALAVERPPAEAEEETEVPGEGERGRPTDTEELTRGDAGAE